MRLPVLFTAVLILTAGLFAQDKKPLDHDVYDFWNFTKQQSISADGAWTLYAVKPQNGDGALTFKSLQDGRAYTIARGDSARFSYMQPYAAFIKRAPLDSVKKAKREKKKGIDAPQDSLGLINLQDGSLRIVDVVRSYKMPKKAGGWIAWLHAFPGDQDTVAEDSSAAMADSLQSDETEDKKEPAKRGGRTLTVYNFQTGDSLAYEDVTEYVFSENGNYLSFSVACADSSNDGVRLLNLKTAALSTVMQKAGDYKKLVFDKSSTKLAFISNADSVLTDQKDVALYNSAVDKPRAVKIAGPGIKGLPPGWWVSPHAKVRFSESGKRLLFGSAPRPEPEDDDEDKEEQATLDIWHWKDPLLQPQQLKQLKKEQKRTYSAFYDFDSKSIVQIGQKNMPEISISNKGDGRYALGISDLPYLRETSWDFPGYYDFYSIDLENNRAKKIGIRIQSGADISPGGRYIYWWDRDNGHWMAYDNRAQEEINLSANVPVDLRYHLHDWPYKASSEGVAGWTEDDEEFIFYDKHDIWAVDPQDTAEPRNLSGGYGHENNLELRYKKLDRELEFLPTDKSWMISAFDYGDKSAGYARLNPRKSGSIEILIKDKKHFASLKKAENAAVLTYTREDFREFPDYWVTDLSFESPRKVSNINPQQEEYLWGSAEPAKWISLDGRELEGIICKPANFDPQKKYPMMVYFYEKNSHNLYRHDAPQPHRSIINFSFYASRGYVIFIPDIPYKDGFPGESAYDAVMAGVQHMIEKGYVDKDRIGVQGHSWGGYQIAYLVTRTDLFRAAEAGAPVANMTSAYGGIRWGTGKSRMFQYEMTQSRIGGTLWEKPLLYIENSPLFFADQVNTPLLIMHNDHDGHVPWYQGIELFVALRRLNKPSWLINYNNQPHWPITFVNKKDWAVRLQQYFDYYLKDAPPARWIIEGVPALEKGKTLGTELMEEGN